MKTHLIVAVASLLVVGNVAVSCNSCEDKNNDPIPSGTPEVSAQGNTGAASGQNDQSGASASAGYGTAGTSGSGNGGANTPSDNYANEGATAGSPSTMGTSVNKSRDVARGTSSAKTKSKSGYSAPNGTDAENHDGDPYTKHDTTPMPTGTSIR
ncbi:MAG TPA: hypothetical protein VF676_01010 [Flavobacterium sp.]|jgi:hypothetical protein